MENHKHNDLTFYMQMSMIEMSLKTAKDLLNDNFHFYVWMKPEYYLQYAETYIREAELELDRVELSLKSRPKGLKWEKFV